MTERVPGTEGPDTFGKSFADVFTPILRQILIWLAWLGGGLMLLSWATGTAFLRNFTGFWLCWIAAYVAMKFYHAGAEAGIKWQREQSNIPPPRN